MGDVVERLGGLDSQLDADRLPQGQRQRQRQRQRQLMCLARAILADKKIVQLDEASSNIDERSERLILDVIREQFVGCTVIAIVHRLGAVADFDHVAVMSAAAGWSSGIAPQALLARDSEFKRLWDEPDKLYTVRVEDTTAKAVLALVRLRAVRKSLAPVFARARAVSMPA
ncbi:P-loop containing nucleoside triphosphate hydrolase protein [Lasiosphaeria ovina]|uniref:P-loop containing nucleoside triphosphate hydrolase protein n=1 Tax=Lasiosphaeria ovina TaxID=92902 RepID=A0AAE0JV89_9PEZI|nr:P-loop containing nucleoside triphosphate hydrolase protein [Lasiosphaeria ovina]